MTSTNHNYKVNYSDTSTRTYGIIKSLRNYYMYNALRLKSFGLCPYVDHFQTAYQDKDYGCGYRNFQMMLSYLFTVPHMKSLLFDGTGSFPPILKIQEILEEAWRKGFDRMGASDLNFKLRNTTKWIGTSEIAVLFSFFKIRTGIYEFKSPHPNQPNNDLIKWIVNYFSKNSKQDFLSPLYLQHSGHSRTVVGYEESSDGSISILIFDPAMKGRTLAENIKNSKIYPIKTSSRTFTKKEYQILAIKPKPLSDYEWEQSKILKRETGMFSS
uniref:UFSP1/2/DUB catalytic domain-containing protein n=1 Tax=Arcella intermedia TaxID=1963864 RepID=A0A6B2LD29_9EUKA